MEKNINLKITKANYPKKPEAVTNASGFAYFANYTIDDSDNEYKVATGFRKSLFEVLDKALGNILENESLYGNTVNLTINLPAGATLSPALQAFLVDKYKLEDEFTSITFA